MVHCRSTKCLNRQKRIVRAIMATLPEKYRFNYEEVRKRAKPFVQKKEWKVWVYEQEI